MATFKVLLDKRRQLINGCYPLVLRVYNGSTFKDINLKTPLAEKHFDSSAQKVKGKHPNKKLINQKISQAILQVQQTTLKLEMSEEVVTSEKIKNLVIKPQAKLDFMQYGWAKVNELIECNQYGNSCIYRDALNSLKKYSDKTRIAFQEINYQFLKGLENKMLTGEVKVNTIALSFRTIRAIYNRAIKEKLVDKSYYPFDEYRIKHEATAKRAIERQDIYNLINLSLEQGSPEFKARDYFLLSFNLIGMSFADMAAIKPSDIVNGRLVYKRKKTHKLYSIKLTEKAKEILESYKQDGNTYILPIIPEIAINNPIEERKYIQYGTKTCNKYLSKIGSELKLGQELTTYVARHSWATCAKKMGYSKDLISEALGHSNGNRITEIYLGSYDKEVLDAMNERVCNFSI